MAQAGRAVVEFVGDYSKLDTGLASVLAPTKLGKMGKVGGLAIGGALAAAVGGAAVTKALYDLGSQFDRAFDNIRVGTGKTGKQLQGLERDFKAVYKTVPSDMDMVAASIAGLNKRLGLTGKPLQDMARNVSELSRLTDTDLETNIKAISRAFVDWEVPVRKQAKTLDGFYRISQKSGAAVSDIATDVQKFGSPLRTLGFGLDEAASMFANFERAGVNSQTMVPGFKLAIGNLVKPTNDLKKNLGQLGVATGNPEKGLREIMGLLTNGSDLSKVEKMSLAMDVFGKRAGADMAEAIKQGRFNLGAYIKEFADGNETIRKSARDTNDAGENFAIFAHKVQVLLEPLSSLIYGTFSDFSKVLADLKINQYAHQFERFTKTNEDFKDVLAAVKLGVKAFGAVAKFAFSIMKEQFKGAWQYVKGAMLSMKGLIKVVSGVLTGDWRKAWAGVKDIFRGGSNVLLGVLRALTAPVRKIVAKVGEGITGVFGSAWDKVESIFVGGARAVIGVVNSIIKAINLIPGVPDIGLVEGPKTKAQKTFKTFQRGGPINIGKPSGDSVPALLERGEYVLNREAVKAVGKDKLDHINFKKAARFQKGGPIGLISGGDVTGAIGDAAGAVTGAARGAANLAMKGPNFFIGKLPDPNIPEPFTGVGPWAVKAATDYIKDKVNPFAGGNAASYPGLPGGAGMFQGKAVASWIIPILTWAQSHGWSGSITSGVRSAAHNATIPGASPTSNHLATAYPGGAIDVGGFGSRAEGQALASVLAKYPGDPNLVWGGPVMNDWGHFSATGHQKGGLIGKARKLMVGGAAEHGVVRKVGADLLSHGYDFRSTAGILGNAWREGLWNPSQMEMTGYDNGGLWGFTASPKSMPELRAFADSKGKPWDDPVVQTHFMMRSGGASIKGGLNALGSIPETTKYFMDKYEIPAAATAALDIRTSAAFDAAKILQDAGITKPGDEAGGDTGPSAAEKAKSVRETRKKKRTGIIEKLRDALRGKSGVERVGGLWELVSAFTKYGSFGGREKSFLLSQAGLAAKQKSPVSSVSILNNLSKFLESVVGISGEPGTNKELSLKLREVKERNRDKAQAKKDRIFSKIQKSGVSYPFKEKILGVDGIIASLAERLNISETLAQFEGGPGGSDLTEAEKADQVSLNQQILSNQTMKSGWLNKAIAALYAKETKLDNELYLASPKNSLTHWKFGALKSAMKAARSGITTLDGYRESLVGVTGRGGEIFDTQMRLKNLGVASTVESAAAAKAAAGISISDVLQIVEASKYNVFDRMPKFHTGGVIPGSGEQPIMAMGGETIRTREQEAALNGGVTVELKFADGMGWLKDFVTHEIKEDNRSKDKLAKVGVR